ncbi:hypothetical protein Zmor_004878 [Zophobas morio]|uniref:Uncharacterized protein n=1 Tax=Zophobas morio TaxID=2755281 RepID=A0AA38MLD9_9CUCU|nr:hypothetical protein Zmor_004878 [Zophobas morio]
MLLSVKRNLLMLWSSRYIMVCYCGEDPFERSLLNAAFGTQMRLRCLTIHCCYILLECSFRLQDAETWSWDDFSTSLIKLLLGTRNGKMGRNGLVLELGGWVREDGI